MDLAVGSEASVGVYRWYQQVKNKDLGETRKDWLEHLREQAKLRLDNNNTVRCMQDDVAERNRKIEEEEEEEKRGKDSDESALNVGVGRHSGRVSPTLQGVLSTPQNSHKRRNVQQNNQNELEAENMTTRSKKAKYSSPMTPKQEVRSPFSMFQEPGFITPTLVLQKGDIGTPDLSLFSPTVPISDIFSPRTSTGNSTGDIVTSLGGNLDDSLVTWTSALATPTSLPQAGDKDGHTSPSTLERLTLHPKQGLRQNVMARSLFSPHTRSVKSPSTSEKCSPGLGIIKGLSPLPVFINKLTTEAAEKTNIDNESKEKFLINDTQTFRISFGRRCMESMEEDSHQKVQLSKGRRRSIVTTDTEHTWNIKGPERTSTPVRVTPQSRTSLLPRHLVLADDIPEPQECSEMIQITQIDHKADNAKETEKMQTLTTNIIVREHLNTNNIHVSLQSDVTENSDELSLNPIDLICSPVKVIDKKCVEGMNSEAKLKNTCQDVTAGYDVKAMSSGTNIRKPDAEEQPVISGNIQENIDTCMGPDLNIAYNNDVNHHVEMYNPNSKLSLPSEAEIINEKAEEKFKDSKLKESSMTRNQSTDNGHLILEEKKPEQSGLCNAEAASHGSLSVPLFKKTSCKYLDCNEESPVRDASDGAKTPISTSSDSLQGKSILNKLSLRKKKNSSGKFLYPSKSEEGYEKLKMTYTETIGQVESSSNSFLEPQALISKIHTACSTSSVLKVFPDIHSIANKQQNFLSLTSLEKDTRFENNNVSLSDKTTYSPLGFDKEKSSSPRNQLVPADEKRSGCQWNSSRTVCVASPGARGAVRTAFDDPHDTFTDADILTISTQADSQKPLNSEQVLFNTTLPKSNCCNDEAYRRLSGGLSRELQQNGDQSKMVVSELQVVPERDLTKEENTLAVSSYSHGHEHDQFASPHILQQEGFSQIMNDSLNDVYLSEMDTNPCVPVLDEVVIKSRMGEVQQASVLDLGVTGAPSNTFAPETDDRYQNYDRENISSVFYASRGKQMKVSKEALERVTKLVKKLPSDGSLKVEDTSSDKIYAACVAPHGVNANDKTHQFSSPMSISGHFPTVCSFTTAGGSRVTVNPAAVAKAKKLWEEENCVTECDPENSDTDVQDHSDILHRALQEKKVAIAHDDRESFQIHTLKTDTCVTVEADSESLLNKSCQMLHKETKDCVSNTCDGRSNDMQDSSSKLVNKYQCVGAPDEASSSMRGFQGFSTASGSKINISKEALKKAKLLWEENTGGSDPDEHNTMNEEKSARSGCRVPDASHTPESQQQVSGCSPADYNASEGTVLSAASSNSPKLKTSRSAVSKSSHGGLFEAQSLLNESENFKSHLGSEPITVKIIDKCNERSMKTLPIKNNSPVPQSKHNMAVCISNDNTNVSHISSIGNIYHQSKGESFSGFHTARGKRVSLTEAAIARAKTLWEESDCNVMVTNNSTSLQDDGNKLILSSRIPFLEKQVNILSENVAPSHEEQSNITQQNAWEKSQPLQFCKSERSLLDVRLPLDTSYTDFQRAGTSNLLSKLVIKQEETKQYHLDEEKQAYLLNEMNHDTSSLRSAPSFATARGKQILISREALCKAKNILSEDLPSNNGKEVNSCTEQSSYNHKQVQGKESGTKLQSLRRAGGAEVHVSQSALEKAHKFLTEDKVDEKPIISWQPEEAPIENVNIINESKVEASKSGCGDGASVLFSPNINERGEIQEDGKCFTENLCMVNDIELRNTETKYINALAGEARGRNKSSENSEGAGQPLSTKAKLSVCVKKPAQTSSLDDKTSKASSKDTQSSSAEFKERICNINTSTEASRDPACINISLLGTPEPTEKINKSFVEDGDMLENYAHRSPSPILGSQKCREISVNMYANLAVNMRIPAQQDLKVHNYNRNNIQNCVSVVDGNLHLPLPSIEAENHANGRCEVKSISKTPQSSDTVEITEITEAFLKDDDWEQEETQKGLVCRRKRRQELTQEKQENGDSNSKMQRISTDIVHLMDESVTANIQECDEVAAEREMLRLRQMKMIRSKQTVRVQPIQGSLHRIRSERKMERHPLQSLGPLKIFSGWEKITAKTAVKYQFQVEDKRCSSVACGDECSVVPDVCGCIGVKQIEEGFLAMPGVQPGLLPPGWLPNHYRWIVWKLAALERRLLNCRALTLENIIARLKYRYDREIDRAERPVLRKITERDDIPQKTMILCVVNIMTAKHGVSDVASNEMKPVSPSGQKDLLELTDGWYSIGAVVDSAMSHLLRDGRVEIGTKLVIHGAELMGSSEACHPLEASSTLQLRLHTNMTRRARWWSRLGLVPQKGPMRTLIGATLSDGGLVGRMNLTLARVYPLVYFERCNGRPIFRGEKAHMRILKETQQEKEAFMHKVVAEVERELNKKTKENQQENRTVLAMTKEEIRNLTMGRDIAKFMDQVMDPSSLEGLLTRHQVELARSWQQHQAEDRRRNINREVERRMATNKVIYEATPLLKIRVVDQDGGGALVTIWRPSEDLRQTLTEGRHVIVCYLMAAGIRNGSLQLTATRQTRWERDTSEHPLDSFTEFDRHVTPLCVMSSGEFEPMWKEVDVVGVVLRVGLLDKGSQIVHIVDHHVNIVALKFWGGVKECGVEDIMKISCVVCVLNGSWRGHTGGRFGCVHVTEVTTITTAPRSAYLHESLAHLKESIKNMKNLLLEGDMKLDGQFDRRAFPAELMSVRGQTQVVEVEPCLDDSTNVSKIESGNATDDTSLLGISSETITDPKLVRVCQRSREVRGKLKTLGQYGMPSALRALQSPAAIGVRKPFRVPFKQPQKFESGEDKSV